MPGALRLMHQARAAAGTPYLEATVDSLLGDVYTAAGQPAEALTTYSRAVEAWPVMTAAVTGRARSMAQLDRVDEAIEILTAEVDRLPAIGPAILLGDLLTGRGRVDEAADAYDLVAVAGRLQEEAGATVDLDLAIFQADHRLESYLGLAEAAYAARPDNIYAAQAMAWALHRTGRTSDALPYIEQALRLGTRDAVMLYHAAAIFDAAGDQERAERLLFTAMEIRPSISAAYAQDAIALAEELGVETR